MLKRMTVAAVLALALLSAAAGSSLDLEETWKDFVHYVKIGHAQLAEGYAQAILDANPDPVEMVALSRANPQDYQILVLVRDSKKNPQLSLLISKILALIERGTFERRTDAPIIAEQVRRLSKGQRAWMLAVKRLQAAGEYAVPFMLDAIGDESRKSEFTDIVRALPYIGNDGIRPLAAALQAENPVVRVEIVRALGEMGYPRSLAYLRYAAEKDPSPEVRAAAAAGVVKIDPRAQKVPAAEFFFNLAEKYYYHADSLKPKEDANSLSIWFWDAAGQKLEAEKVDKSYFFELMAMRCCEWALRADPGLGKAIGLWVAAFFKAESTGVPMPAYFGPAHADALVYATTAGVQYLHQALARALKDKDAYVALGAVEALAATAGEKSMFYQLGPAQPLLQALSFNNRAVRYSAAIAIASAGPGRSFAEHKLVIANLAQALGPGPKPGDPDAELWSDEVADTYAVRAAEAMLKLAETRNRVIDLSLAQKYLVAAIDDKRPQIQKLAGKILAHLDSPDAQRAIASMALNGSNSNEVRVAAFESLATSAKLNGNMLLEQMLDDIYALIRSDQTDPALRSAAAAAFGSLDLPSQKVKDLILDQAKS